MPYKTLGSLCLDGVAKFFNFELPKNSRVTKIVYNFANMITTVIIKMLVGKYTIDPGEQCPMLDYKKQVYHTSVGNWSSDNHTNCNQIITDGHLTMLVYCAGAGINVYGTIWYEVE